MVLKLDAAHITMYVAQNFTQGIFHNAREHKYISFYSHHYSFSRCDRRYLYSHTRGEKIKLDVAYHICCTEFYTKEPTMAESIPEVIDELEANASKLRYLAEVEDRDGLSNLLLDIAQDLRILTLSKCFIPEKGVDDGKTD